MNFIRILIKITYRIMNYSNSIYRQQDYHYQDYHNYVDEHEYSSHSEASLKHANSIYSDINEKNKNEKNEQLKEKVISDIISFYTNDEPVISELIPLPISPENLAKLKNQWNKEDKFSMKINEKEKTVWKRISDSFKKQSSPKRSLYDILTK